MLIIHLRGSADKKRLGVPGPHDHTCSAAKEKLLIPAVLDGQVANGDRALPLEVCGEEDDDAECGLSVRDETSHGERGSRLNQ